MNTRREIMLMLTGTLAVTGLAMGQLLPPLDPTPITPVDPGPIAPGPIIEPVDPTPVIPPTVVDPTVPPVSPGFPPLVAPFTPVAPSVITEEQPPSLCGTAIASALGFSAVGLMLLKSRKW